MFGYLGLEEAFTTYKVKNAYRNYYCGTCFSLQYNYGQRARFLLSYDVTILAVIAGLLPESDYCNLKCIGRNCRKQIFKNENWKKIAGINILLAAEKMKDDIKDNHSLKAMLMYIFYYNIIKKVSKDYPKLKELINEGYKNIIELEKQNQCIEEIAEKFSDMMINISVNSYHIDNIKIDYLLMISKWVYIIDAINDYDKDYKDNIFNPLLYDVNPQSNLYDYLNCNWKKMTQLLTQTFSNSNQICIKLNDNSIDSDILISIFQYTIKLKAIGILSRGRNYTSKKMMREGNVWRKIR